LSKSQFVEVELLKASLKTLLVREAISNRLELLFDLVDRHLGETETVDLVKTEFLFDQPIENSAAKTSLVLPILLFNHPDPDHLIQL